MAVGLCRKRWILDCLLPGPQNDKSAWGWPRLLRPWTGRETCDFLPDPHQSSNNLGKVGSHFLKYVLGNIQEDLASKHVLPSGIAPAIHPLENTLVLPEPVVQTLSLLPSHHVLLFYRTSLERPLCSWMCSVQDMGREEVGQEGCREKARWIEALRDGLSDSAASWLEVRLAWLQPRITALFRRGEKGSQRWASNFPQVLKPARTDPEIAGWWIPFSSPLSATKKKCHLLFKVMRM